MARAGNTVALSGRRIAADGNAGDGGACVGGIISIQNIDADFFDRISRPTGQRYNTDHFIPCQGHIECYRRILGQRRRRIKQLMYLRIIAAIHYVLESGCICRIRCTGICFSLISVDINTICAIICIVRSRYPFQCTDTGCILTLGYSQRYPVGERLCVQRSIRHFAGPIINVLGKVDFSGFIVGTNQGIPAVADVIRFTVDDKFLRVVRIRIILVIFQYQHINNRIAIRINARYHWTDGHAYKLIVIRIIASHILFKSKLMTG